MYQFCFFQAYIQGWREGWTVGGGDLENYRRDFWKNKINRRDFIPTNQGRELPAAKFKEPIIDNNNVITIINKLDVSSETSRKLFFGNGHFFFGGGVCESPIRKDPFWYSKRV